MVNKKVSLYIPCYNAEQYLHSVLPAVMMQTYPIEEVLIIDDGSTDNTVRVAEKFIPFAKYPLKIIKHETNLGLGTARNTGAKNSIGDFIASIDADVVPDIFWLENLMKEFDSNNNIVGGCGCLIEMNPVSIGNYYRSKKMRQCFGDKKLFNPLFLYGSNTVYKKSVIFEAGLYNERCKTNGEDIDLSNRIKNMKYNINFTPEARCYHLQQDTFKSSITRRWRYKYHGLLSNVTFTSTIRANTQNFRFALTDILQDLKNKYFKAFIIDIFLPFYSCYLDWKTYFKRTYND